MSVRRVLNGFLRPFGYKVAKFTPEADMEPEIHHGFTLYNYRTEDGKFDYEKYRQIQTEGNKKKIDRVWVQEENIDFLSRYIAERIGTPQFGICHGTRRGLEQSWFGARLKCKVIGTEISDTAAQFPNTIQWDFHEVKQEWVGAVDFIYSNSFDHSYDPEKCINAWMSCVKPGGFASWSIAPVMPRPAPLRSIRLAPISARCPTSFRFGEKGRFASARSFKRRSKDPILPIPTSS
ncbi:MAG: hypothetical protein MPW14_18850 [Candidatus Manganitrophus sp.]|nr:MAG: hypothetical protein MPW14_18850 [Candidatus Manganitrophus sp.]